MMPSVAVLVVATLAVARITTLVTHDEITRPIREFLIAKFNPYSRTHRVLVYLLGAPDGDAIGCPWCVSIWVGAIIATIAYSWGATPICSVIMLSLAMSQVTGMIYTYGRQG